MDENNVVTTTSTDSTENTVEQTTTVKTEPKKDEKPVNAEVEKLKAALSKANGEAAEYKRQLREKQSETERAEAERLESEKAMREELEQLRKERAVNDGKTRSLAIGIDEENADIVANATAMLTDDDKNALFDALKAFVEATKTRLANEALNRQPGLSTGTPPTTNTTVDEEYEKMRRWMGAPARR